MVNGQFIDSHDQLWFATEGGLCQYNPAEKKFKTYTINDGLPSNFLFKILEDENDNQSGSREGKGDITPELKVGCTINPRRIKHLAGQG